MLEMLQQIPSVLYVTVCLNSLTLNYCKITPSVVHNPGQSLGRHQGQTSLNHSFSNEIRGFPEHSFKLTDTSTGDFRPWIESSTRSRLCRQVPTTSPSSPSQPKRNKAFPISMHVSLAWHKCCAPSSSMSLGVQVVALPQNLWHWPSLPSGRSD